MRNRWALTFALALLFAACGGEEPEQTQPAYCNPLSAVHCMLPWPSTYYLEQDSATNTGLRVSYPALAMPESADQKRVDAARYNLLDGFSIGSQILIAFEAGVSKEGLPGIADLARSVTPESPIWLMRFDDGERVPVFAEIDANPKPDEMAALIIRPQAPLEFDTRYVVAIRDGLRDRDGLPLEPPAPFRRLRDGKGTADPSLRTLAAGTKEIMQRLEEQGLRREQVVLAWDFHTASHEAVTGNLQTMVEDALGRLPEAGGEVVELGSTDFDSAEEPHLLRHIEGMMLVPSYLESDDDDAWLKLDADGRPQYRTLQRVPFVVHIPRCAEQASGPIPVLVFGHGLFGSSKELDEPYHKELHDRLCMVQVNTPWWGLSQPDLAPIASTVGMDWSQLPRITDRLQQAHVNIHALVKLMQGSFLQRAEMQVDGRPVADGRELYYLGISNGGTQGMTFAALSADIERHVFNVPGGWWSMMLQRSSKFVLFAMMLERVYPDPVDRLILFSISQQLWDYTDPINFVRHLRTEPLPGRSPKRIVLQEARYDELVPNFATRAVLRGIDLPLMSPRIEAVYGVEELAGPLDSAYVQWDTDPPLKPSGGNVPAIKPEESADSAHHVLRTLDSCIRQMELFFTPDGKVQHTCDGACDPE